MTEVRPAPLLLRRPGPASQWPCRFHASSLLHYRPHIRALPNFRRVAYCVAPQVLKRSLCFHCLPFFRGFDFTFLRLDLRLPANHHNDYKCLEIFQSNVRIDSARRLLVVTRTWYCTVQQVAVGIYRTAFLQKDGCPCCGRFD